MVVLYSLEKNYRAKIYNSLIDEQDGDILGKLMNFQKELKKNGDKPINCLVLFDDFITDASSNKKHDIYDKLYSMGIITTSQQYTLFPSNIRTVIVV